MNSVMQQTRSAKNTKVETKLSDDLILLRYRYLRVPEGESKARTTKEYFATVISNMAYFGFAPSKEACQRLMKLGNEALGEWWTNMRPHFEEYTGANRKMDRFVVYKNFPQEVLDMSEGEYWIKQILMYIGFPAPWFAQKEVERETMSEDINLKVLHLSDDSTFNGIFRSLLNLPNKWVDSQVKEAEFLLDRGEQFDLASIPFKENMVNVAKLLIDRKITPSVRSASDVLRLAAGMSDGDISLRTNSKFKSFSRSQRRFLLEMLENIPAQNVEDDFAMRKEQWKRLLSYLHPNDFGNKFKRTCGIYDKLYRNEVSGFQAQFEALLLYGFSEALDFLSARPGEFMRQLRRLISMSGTRAVKKFEEVAPRLTVIQLLKLRGYMLHANERIYRTFAPRGNWTLLQVKDNDVRIKDGHRLAILGTIEKQLKLKLEAITAGNKFDVSEDTRMIKLQTNDSEVTPYGRGTVFPIPDEVNFIRTASYWKVGKASTVWFDNSWNFFDENWQSVGVCCWTDTKTMNGGAVFSGDPVSGGEMQGRAAQMIDLYLNKLQQSGVRYAVWNILCYSGIPFSGVEEVFGALQWGKDEQKGKLFEPSRCQLAFPLKGDSMTKYVAYIDVKKRELVYIDANLRGSVRSAAGNGERLSKTMPAFVEYLDTLPSVHDLMRFAPAGKRSAVKVLYSDKDVSLKNGVTAYVFKPENQENSFQQADLTSLLK